MVLDAARGHLRPRRLKLFEVCRLPRRFPIITLHQQARPRRAPASPSISWTRSSATLALDVTPASWRSGHGAGFFLGTYDLFHDAAAAVRARPPARRVTEAGAPARGPRRSQGSRTAAAGGRRWRSSARRSAHGRAASARPFDLGELSRRPTLTPGLLRQCTSTISGVRELIRGIADVGARRRARSPGGSRIPSIPIPPTSAGLRLQGCRPTNIDPQHPRPRSIPPPLLRPLSAAA